MPILVEETYFLLKVSYNFFIIIIIISSRAERIIARVIREDGDSEEWSIGGKI